MTSRAKKWLISYLVFLAVACFLTAFIATRDNDRPALKRLAKSIGLEDVVLKPHTFMAKDGDYDYVIKSKKFSSLSYDKMFSIDDELESFSWKSQILHYESNGDVYEIDSYSRVITKNGEEVYRDYLNSPEYKSELKKIEAEKAKKTEYASKLPFPGMSEEYIDYTKLGRPDEKEYSRDYHMMRSDRRSITYKWHDEKGWPYITATVREGIVTSVWEKNQGTKYLWETN